MSSVLFKPLPWYFYEDDVVNFWVHYGLVILGFLLAVITAIVQTKVPAPYGKHETPNANWGPLINQRIGHTLSDAIPGILLFSLVFFLYGNARDYANYTFYAMFISHYIQRGIIHPLTMRYRNKMVPVGITLGGFFPNCLFHFLNAQFIGNAVYDYSYYYDPRFITGIVLFVISFIINRWADWYLRSLRTKQGEDGSTGYYIPHGGLFELVSCPNYFGELVEWIGWTIATWSLAGLVWCLFSAATFFPRSWHNHKWYQQEFQHYPRKRKALIPFVY